MDEVKSRVSRVFFYVKEKTDLMCKLDESAARAVFAKMRRGVGKAPGDDPALWEVLFDRMPEDLIGRDNAPSREEWAIYAALTLFALHQQGKSVKTDNMNASVVVSAVEGKERTGALGAAVAKLAGNDDGSRDAVRRRFNAMATSSDMAELTWHLRGIVELLKREALPLDYPTLATELYNFQFIDRRPSVRLKWGRDYYREQNKYNKPTEAVKEKDHD